MPSEIRVSETLDFVKKIKEEGRSILLIGDTGYTKDTDKLYTFTSKEDAIKQLTLPKEEAIQTVEESAGASAKSGGNATSTATVTKTAEKREEAAFIAFIKAVSDIFSEADANHAIHGIGLSKIYAVNVGKGAKKTEMVAAWAAAEKEARFDMEVYPGLTDTGIINGVKEHLDEIKGYGDYRIAIATVKPDENVNNVIKSVQQDGKSSIDSSRIVLHTNPDMVGALAAKIACTPYYEDPAKNPYYTVDPKEIKLYNREDLDKLLNAGLVADQIKFREDGTRVAEISLIRSTSYTDDDHAADSYLHQRLNADYHARVTDNIARKYIKTNNTESARHLIEGECRAYLNREVEYKRLVDYGYDVHPKEDDPYSLMVDMSIRLPRSIHIINIKRTIRI